MSVRINYKGNIGNCLFQYVYTRMLAERNGLYMDSPFPYQKLLQTTPHVQGQRHNTPKIVFDEPYILDKKDGSGPDLDDIEKRHTFYDQLAQCLDPGQYILNGYFEYSMLFNPYEQQIKSFFKINERKKNVKDIVMNIRLGDFADLGRIIHPNWYIDILDHENFDCLYIVGGEANEPYLNAFKKFDPIIVPSNPVNDFHLISSFDKIICSNSTFCWWAAFLSDANTIYNSDKWISPLLNSCKNSINIKAEHLTSYTTSFYYSPVQQLINFSDKIKLALDRHFIPTKDQAYRFVDKCIKIIYNAVRNNPAVKPYILQLDIKGVGSYAMNFYSGGSWLSQGSALLPDCSISFADHTSFYEWIHRGLRDIGDPYIDIKGSIDAMVEWFDLLTYEKELVAIYNDLVNNSSLLKYCRSEDIMTDIIYLLQQDKSVVFFEKDASDMGKLYLWSKNIFDDTDAGTNESFRKYFFMSDVVSSTSMQFESQVTKINYQLEHQAIAKHLRVISFKKTTSQLISFEDVLKLFTVIPANYLVLDRYIIDKQRLDADRQLSII